jgi:hypothetical protein
MSEIITADNTAPEPTAPETPAEVAPNPTELTEPAAPAQPESIDTTKAFSQRLNQKQKEWEQAHLQELSAKDQAITAAKQRADEIVERAWGHLGIHTQEELDAYEGAQQIGVPVEVYNRMTAAERKATELEQKTNETAARLTQYERRDALTAAAESYAAGSTKFSDFFKANREEILKTAVDMKGDGLTPEEHLNAALMYVLADKYEPPKPVDEKAIGEAAVKAYLESINKIGAPVEARGGGIPNTPPVSTGNAIRDAELMTREMLKRGTQ